MTDAVNPTLIPAHGVAFPDETDTATFDARASALFKYFVGNFFSGANVLADQAYTNALAAQESAGIAAAIANYKGPWSGLTGALAIPAAVSHSGKLWLLLSSVADVTTKVPGVAAEWFDVTPMNRSGGEFLGNVDLPSLNGGAPSELRNRLINGDCRVVQYGGLAAVAAGASVHIADGWRINNSSDAVLSASIVSDTLADGRRVNWLSATVSTADTAISSTQYCFFKTVIEGYDVSDLVGRTFTISGVVQSAVAGVHSVELRNSGLDRSYIGEVNVAAANTPQDFTITVTGGLPSAGTWDFSNGVGLELGFMLAAGSSYVGSVGNWLVSGRVSSASQVNVLATAGNVFRVANVQIEVGSNKTPISRPPYAVALARCQRYYVSKVLFINGYGVAGTVITQLLDLPVPMRSNLATLSQGSPVYTNCSANALFMGADACTVGRSVTVAAAGNASHSGSIVVDARF